MSKKIITYNVKCGHPLILGHKGEHHNKIIKFNGIDRVTEDSSLYFYLKFQNKTIAKIILCDRSFELIQEFTSISSTKGLKGQVKEHLINGDIEELRNCSDEFQVEVRGAIEDTEDTEVTDVKLTLWGAKLESLYNEINTKLINGDFKGEPGEPGKDGKITQEQINEVVVKVKSEVKEDVEKLKPLIISFDYIGNVGEKAKFKLDKTIDEIYDAIADNKELNNVDGNRIYLIREKFYIIDTTYDLFNYRVYDLEYEDYDGVLYAIYNENGSYLTTQNANDFVASKEELNQQSNKILELENGKANTVHTHNASDVNVEAYVTLDGEVLENISVEDAFGNATFDINNLAERTEALENKPSSGYDDTELRGLIAHNTPLLINVDFDNKFYIDGVECNRIDCTLDDILSAINRGVNITDQLGEQWQCLYNGDKLYVDVIYFNQSSEGYVESDDIGYYIKWADFMNFADADVVERELNKKSNTNHTHKNYEDRIKALEEKPSGGSTDVQINGTSITQDGVADIPIATQEKSGVIKTHTYYGTRMGTPSGTSKDIVMVESSNNTDINNRTNNFKPIVPYNLDNAVKAAMCDGKGAEWTSEEKYKAQERIGFNKAYKWYTEVEVEEETRYFEVDINQELSGYFITLRNNNGIMPNTTVGGIYIQWYSSHSNQVQYLQTLQTDKKFIYAKCEYMEKEKCYICESNSNNNGYGLTAPALNFFDFERVTLRKLGFNFQETNKMQPGTKITIGVW